MPIDGASTTLLGAATDWVSMWLSIGVALLAGFIAILLAVIAVFLKRLLSQFDKLTEKVSNLDTTLTRIDVDLSGELRLLEVADTHLEKKLEALEPMWDRLREAESRLTVLETACPAKNSISACHSQ